VTAARQWSPNADEFQDDDYDDDDTDDVKNAFVHE